MARLLGCAVAVVLILSVAFTVFFLYHRQQKNRLEMDGGGTALPLSQEPEPSPSRQSHLALEDIQTLGLELEKQQLQQEEDEPQKLPPQPAYYDLGASPSYHPLMLLYASPEEEPHPASRPYHPDLQNRQFPPSFSPFLCSLAEKLIEKFSLDFRFSGNPNFALGKRLLMPFSSFLYKGQVLSAKIEFVVQGPPYPPTPPPTPGSQSLPPRAAERQFYETAGILFIFRIRQLSFRKPDDFLKASLRTASIRKPSWLSPAPLKNPITSSGLSDFSEEPEEMDKLSGINFMP
ncbi:hypothetical protein MJT46_010017 [Ovis ammon polii x Ovis aries]|nr:hypothetical protein MJT46_010017 [Ovis ammon polii x Ovis aries]